MILPQHYLPVLVWHTVSSLPSRQINENIKYNFRNLPAALVIFQFQRAWWWHVSSQICGISTMPQQNRWYHVCSSAFLLQIRECSLLHNRFCQYKNFVLTTVFCPFYHQLFHLWPFRNKLMFSKFRNFFSFTLDSSIISSFGEDGSVLLLPVFHYVWRN